MISSELQKAIDCLQINDVYMRNSVAFCEDEFNPKYDFDESLVFQTKHIVRQANVVELEDGQNLLQVFIEMGARWTIECKDNEEQEPVPKVYVEADFIAEYLMSKKLEKESIDAFALRNASIHVWPYWREFLNSQCTKMHLPRVVLPTLNLAQNNKQSSD